MKKGYFPFSPNLLAQSMIDELLDEQEMHILTVLNPWIRPEKDDDHHILTTPSGKGLSSDR